MANKVPQPRQPGQRGGQKDSDWKNRRTLSAAEQDAQQYMRKGGAGGGGGGGGKSSSGGLCGIITLALLAVPVGAVYGIAQLLG